MKEIAKKLKKILIYIFLRKETFSEKEIRQVAAALESEYLRNDAGSGWWFRQARLVLEAIGKIEEEDMSTRMKSILKKGK
jgi:hypothetical protein